MVVAEGDREAGWKDQETIISRSVVGTFGPADSRLTHVRSRSDGTKSEIADGEQLSGVARRLAPPIFGRLNLAEPLNVGGEPAMNP